MKIKQLIKELRELEIKHGNIDVVAYGSFTKENREIENPYFDINSKKVEIGIYF